MTEPEWLTCTEVEPMLGFLHSKVGDRKLRLFGAGCCRQVWRLLRHEESRQAVEVAEAFADGGATKNQLQKAARGAREVAESLAFEAGVAVSLSKWARRDAAQATVLVAETSIAPGRVAAKAREAIASTPHPTKCQCSILRCLFGPLPFHPVVIEPEWLSWGGGTILALAESVYRECAFNRLPYVGDALEEAGCSDFDILDHCRRQGEHFRGCWVIDLLLGKETAKS